MADNVTNGESFSVVDHFFRHESGRVIAHLTRRFGGKYFEQIEDAVQESLLKAMQQWPFSGLPANPTAWIVRVAQNKMLDNLRHEKIASDKQALLSKKDEKGSLEEVYLEDELKDDLLKMMFACCHPSISMEHQVILALGILSGFSKVEVAKALLKSEEAVAKAYSRAKQKLKQSTENFIVPVGPQLNRRVDIILKIIYLMFNEGYNTTQGSSLIRRDLCEEAMRLTQLILENRLLRKPKVHALLALMCFQASRFDARVDANGRLLTLEEQDRSRWDQEMIQKGSTHFAKALGFGTLSDYHIQAAIAGCHCFAPDFKSTDWKRILELYDLQLRNNYSQVAALNRVVAVAKVKGEKTALDELEKIGGSFQGYYLYYAIKADLLKGLGSVSLAKEQLEKALQLTRNQIEKDHLLEKIASLKAPD